MHLRKFLAVVLLPVIVPFTAIAGFKSWDVPRNCKAAYLNHERIPFRYLKVNDLVEFIDYDEHGEIVQILLARVSSVPYTDEDRPGKYVVKVDNTKLTYHRPERF